MLHRAALVSSDRQQLSYLVSDAPAEHHVRVHLLVHVQAHLGKFGPQHAAFDQVGLSDVRDVPQTSTHTHTHTHSLTLSICAVRSL